MKKELNKQAQHNSTFHPAPSYFASNANFNDLQCMLIFLCYRYSVDVRLRRRTIRASEGSSLKSYKTLYQAIHHT